MDVTDIEHKIVILYDSLKGLSRLEILEVPRQHGDKRFDLTCHHGQRDIVLEKDVDLRRSSTCSRSFMVCFSEMAGL